MSAVAAAEERVRGVSARAARDAVLTGAVELARAAAQDVAESPEDVGELALKNMAETVRSFRVLPRRGIGSPRNSRAASS